MHRSSRPLHRAATLLWLHHRSRAYPRQPIWARAYSSANGSASGFHPSINSTLTQLNSFHLPRFELPENSIDVLTSPADFYATLKEKIAAAEHRIFLASLYIGKSETELIHCLEQALYKNPDLQVYILSDALRGTREAPYGPSSASLLAPLVEQFGSRRVHINMYHTPELHGIQKLIVPRRFNEGWGLQHMKLYGFDDEVILSGANLSSDYFTNRQDRYMLFKSGPLTDYYFKLHQAVSSISYKVVPIAVPTHGPSLADKIKTQALAILGKKPAPNPTFVLRWDPSFLIPEPTKDPRGFIAEASGIIKPLLRCPSHSPIGYDNRPDEEVQKDVLTYVYPISQLSPLFEPNNDPSTEFPVVDRILSMLSLNHFNWIFTAGYLNIHPHYKAKLLQSSPPNAVVVAASPKANGFYLSKGVSGLLPDAYSLLASRFLGEIGQTSDDRLRTAHISLVEWERGTVNTPGGWSYHAKGLWIFEPSGFVKENTYEPAPKREPLKLEKIAGVFKQGAKEEEPAAPPAQPRTLAELEADETIARPVITVVGSSNYTRRAYAHDLESNAIVVTRDAGLQKQLHAEVVNILQHTREVGAAEYEARKPTPVLKALTWLLGGKL